MPHRDGRAVEIPLVVRVEIEADHVREGRVATKLRLGFPEDPVVGFELALPILLRSTDFGAAMTVRRDVHQRLGPTNEGPRPALADRVRGGNRRPDELVLEPADLVGPDAREISDL